MKKSDEIEYYMRDPIRLLDILDQVIKRNAINKPFEIQTDKAVQLNEISKTIERLNEMGTEIPDDLRKMKIELMQEVTEYEKERELYQRGILLLQEMELRIGNSLTKVRALLASMKNKTKSKPKIRRYVKRTSPTILAKEIRKALREIGGSGKKADILEKIKTNMNGQFKPKDLEKDSQGKFNWEKWVVIEKKKMMRTGVIKANSKFGIWELRRK